ncbi:hypothetical protein [Acinetobacter rathckeae]|uniref:hypothetical protein n=1 Tax=Acinetobacter rathckeae TaxID=2605272 RepID=UPI0018A31321|nr:hypothetical protein [Acinetobacter rathckeae]MBF7695857.1 hypothetical protein [Acinetobacter rathckeae]
MTTLQELHNRVGNPDLSHWKTRKMLTVAESALLTSGFDPLLYEEFSDDQLLYELRRYQPQNWQHASMLIKSISEAICTNEIKAPRVIVEYPYKEDWEVKEQIEINIEDEPYLRTTLTKIHRDELSKWLDKNGYFQPTLKEISTKKVISTIQEIQNNNMRLLPEPTYTTPLLEIVNAVVDKFWKGYNPDEAMVAEKQIEIERWIKENYPETSNNYIAKAIDRICRHPSTKTGGNKKL